jgi:tRNA pseudouridine38-40 synthase
VTMMGEVAVSEQGVAVKLVIEYDGQAFHGWQYQPGLPTVQGELGDALRTVLRLPSVLLHAAGRTDAGVHARGQVVVFRCPSAPDTGRLIHAISSILKGRLAVREASLVSPDFHPRRSSLGRRYIYRILNRSAPPVLERGRVLHVVSPLEQMGLQEDAAAFLGTHDFTSFRGACCQALSPVKTIQSSRWFEDAGLLHYEVVGGFLQHQVRIMVGTMLDRARGRIREGIGEILSARSRERAGVTAPPYGLVLDEVLYPEGVG